MPLPQLNAVPQYELIMPSTGKAHKFRPFLVKEEKVLMIAAESQEMSQMVNAIGNIVESCVEGVDKKELSAIDIEYSFLQIRSKSVGEIAKINVDLINGNAQGIYNVGTDLKTMYDLAKKTKVDVIAVNEKFHETMPNDITMDLGKLDDFFE